MSDKTLNQRQKLIICSLKPGELYSLSDIQSFFKAEELSPSVATLRRDLTTLRKIGFLVQTGDRKGSRYKLSIKGMLNSPIDAPQYCAVDIDKRDGSSSFNFDLFQGLGENLFLKNNLRKMDLATKNFQEKSKNSSDIIRKKELERFVIELSWKSSKIEGNTYNLLDTEKLIQKGIEAAGHSKEEAIMILNHKKAFQYILEHNKEAKQISTRFIEDIHQILVEDLGVSFGYRSKQVGITGSIYTPLSVPSQIKEAIQDLCQSIKKMDNPYSKALMALIGISYIQPFEDGNKRTARLLANAILIAHSCAPLSYRSVDENLYKESTLVFYEKNSLIPMHDIFIEQYLFACEHYLQFQKS